MSEDITIRDIPEAIRDNLAARATREGKSMQEYLRAELVKLSERPSVTEWVNAIAQRKTKSGSSVSIAQILKARDNDRR